MALNCSRRPVSPAHIPEDHMVLPVRTVNGYFLEGLSEKNGEGYWRPWNVSRVEDNEGNFSCGRDRVDCCSSSDQTSKDIVDLLPSDPFGMDIKTTFTAITGWLEGLEVDYGGYMRGNYWGTNQEDYGLYAGLNLVWNNSLKHQSLPWTIQLNEELNKSMQSFKSNYQVNQKPNMGSTGRLNTYGGGDRRDMGTGVAAYGSGFEPPCNMDDIVSFNNETASCSSELPPTEREEGCVDFDGVPHEALFYVLSYLGVKDLLSVERVCSSLSAAVRGDPLVWKTIHIDQPLNERIADDALVQLASRSQGGLECLSLVECPKVTDDGLRRVLGTSRRLTKLSVPGCTRITIECIVKTIQAYNPNNEFGGIKHLRIGRIYGVNNEHFEELNMLLGSCNKIGSRKKAHFYHRGNFYLPYDDDRVMDIEMCPRCEKFRLVYDCPVEVCKLKDNSPQVCRACIYCIGRCAQCGRCINDTEFEETFCLEVFCSDCFKLLFKNQNKIDSGGVGSA